MVRHARGWPMNGTATRRRQTKDTASGRDGGETSRDAHRNGSGIRHGRWLPGRDGQLRAAVDRGPGCARRAQGACIDGGLRSTRDRRHRCGCRSRSDICTGDCVQSRSGGSAGRLGGRRQHRVGAPEGDAGARVGARAGGRRRRHRVSGAASRAAVAGDARRERVPMRLPRIRRTWCRGSSRSRRCWRWCFDSRSSSRARECPAYGKRKRRN